MIFRCVISALLACSIAVVSGIHIPGKIVHTTCGPVEGTMSSSRERREYYAWLGIPFAKAPVASRRFQPPEPYGNWSGVLQAKTYPPLCAQYDAIQDLLLGQEDCLYLNIFIAAELLDRTEKLGRQPVMVFLHGGAFLSGSSRDFRPDYFMDEDVILVTVNYRLASFGFLNTGDGLITGNMGLKDQTLALRWIQNNIEFFGGDKNSVTIFGVSAGASSAHYLMLSPSSRGLFQKAISQSGVAASTFAFNKQPREQAEVFAQQLYCPTEPAPDMVKCIQSRSTIEILQVHAQASVWYKADRRRKELLFVPTIELEGSQDAFLTKNPNEMLAAGDFAKIPWVSGVNSAEGLIWMYPFVKDPSFRQQLQHNWNEVAVSELFLNPNERKYAESIRDYYFKDMDLTSPDVFDHYLRLISDRMFYVQWFRAINWHSKEAPVYAYVYDKVGPSFAEVFFSLKDSLPRLLGIVIARAKDFLKSEILGIPRPREGACHGDDFIMFSPYLPLYYIGTKHVDFLFSKQIVRLWLAFATNNGTTPMTFRGVTFPQYYDTSEIEDPSYFRIHEQPRLVKMELRDGVKFWDSIEGNSSTDAGVIEF